MSAAKVELGRHLFYDERLSHNGTMACASCHEQARAFTDGEATNDGRDRPPAAAQLDEPDERRVSVDLHVGQPEAGRPRGAGAGADVRRLPARARGPADTEAILRRFADDARIRTCSPRRSPTTRTPSPSSASRRRSRRSSARWSRATARTTATPTAGTRRRCRPAARRGMHLFFSERRVLPLPRRAQLLDVVSQRDQRGRAARLPEQRPLQPRRRPAPTPTGNGGLYEFTGDPRDQGKFRVPTLRNVALTAPYMHDGSIATLAEVVDHYAAGGREIEDGPNAGDGRENPNKSPLVRPMTSARRTGRPGRVPREPDRRGLRDRPAVRGAVIDSSASAGPRGGLTSYLHM
jgi:cytochrome c peroxidase